MEPGDLRINYYNKQRSFPSDQDRKEAQHSPQDQQSPIYRHSQSKSVAHINSSATSVASLVPDKTQPVKVWRDPHLVASTEIRHVDSLQHSSFMAHHNSGSGRGQPPMNPGSYQQMNNNPSIISSGGGLMGSSSNQGGMIQPRGPPMYGTGMPKNSHQTMWRHRYAHPSVLGVPNVSHSPVEPDIRDYRVEQDLQDKEMDTKLSAAHAVQQHFEVSLRLANQKRGWADAVPKYPPEEPRLTIGRAIDKSPSDKNMYYGPVPGSSPYLPQQVHAVKKTDLPAPPPLHSESMRNDPIRNDPMRNDPMRNDPMRNDPMRNDPMRNDPMRNDPMRNDPMRNDPMRNDPMRNDPMRNDPMRNDQMRNDPMRNEPMRNEPMRNEHMRNEHMRSEHMRSDPIRNEHLRTEPMRSEHLRNEPMRNEHMRSEHLRNEPKVMYGQLDLSERHREPVSSPRIRDQFRTDPKSMYGQLDLSERSREPSIPPHVVREPERPYYSGGGAIQSKNVYSFPPAHVNRIKVSSPAPPQIYGKPLIAATSGPAVRNIYESHIDMAPLSLTSKGNARFSETPPSSSSNSLPKHELRSADLSYYMYSSSQPGQNHFHEKSTPSPQPLPKVEFQTQPLDLGGKRKSDVLPLSLDSKKIKTESEIPMERKPVDCSPIYKYESVPRVKYDNPSAIKFENSSISNDGPLLKQETSNPSQYNSPTSSIRYAPSTSVSLPEPQLPPDALNGVTAPVTVANPPPKTVINKIETVLQMQAAVESSSSTPTKSSSPSPAVAQTSSVKSGSIQKVPKKAWVHLWHHGEDSTNSEDSPIKSSFQSGIQAASKAANSNNSIASTTGGTTDSSINPSESDKGGKVSSNGGSSDNPPTDFNKRETKRMGKKGKGKTANVVNGNAEDNSTSSSDSDTAQEKSTSKTKVKSGTDKKENSNLTESEKESESEDSVQDKDAPTSGHQSDNSSQNAGKRRGRKPRESLSAKSDKKKANPFKRPPINLLKKTGESFLQDGPCSEVSPKLGKCRECRWTPNNRSKKHSNIFCRFYAFRKLRYTKNGVLAIAGFSDPHVDPTQADKSLWLPSKEGLPESLELEMGKFLISQLGDQFCELMLQEREANEINSTQENKTVAWKRIVQGVREMCDVCDTTLFNFHWACGKCGFVVCIACYKARKSNSVKLWTEAGKERDEFQWLFCSNRQSHELEKLMLTQAIPGNTLHELGKFLHDARANWKIEQLCGCPEAKQYESTHKGELMTKLESNGMLKVITKSGNSSADVREKPKEPPTKTSDSSSSEESDDGDDSHSTLRELLILGPKAGKEDANSTTEKESPTSQEKDSTSSAAGGDSKSESVKSSAAAEDAEELKHFIRQHRATRRDKLLPIKVMTLSESTVLYPSVPHSWLCSGTLLRLLDPANPENYSVFQDMWKRGQPIIVSNVAARLTKSLWTPESFSKDFTDMRNDLVNCMTGKLVPNQPMKKFWEGFDTISKRLKDDKGNPMLLKLKDWPPGEDFAELLPTRFKDLMTALPLTEYTHRDGRLNLAARLPDNFVKPDLGPKMYIAYGSGFQLDKGTTNLHLDISDAVNVMVHVGIPKDCDNIPGNNEAVLKAIEESDCDIVTISRITQKKEQPGALWHIYNARDADKIRDLLNKVALERGERLEPHHDAIHDQSWYLDQTLRKRLMQEYNVAGYPIIQCAGDAVFIPAGAPHQVRNLHNCIKIAEDFVSPENVSHCFHLTEEFRNLSATHANHEDKLQIKNIIYHAVKDALSVLLYRKDDDQNVATKTESC